MPQQTKRLGELLVEGGLITPAQLQSAITHQKIVRGRLGSNLVALGYVTEEVLVDFLSRQTGVPRMDVRSLEVPPPVLRLVPHRLADQFTILPVAVRDARTLVLAMADPLDLNAIDSARFASGHQIEPVVSCHSSLRRAIGEHYRRLDHTTGHLAGPAPQDTGHALPVSFTLTPTPQPTATVPAAALRDPFFEGPLPGPVPGIPGFAAPPEAAPLPNLVHSRTLTPEARPLETYQTRTLVLGLIQLFQRRGIIGSTELQRLLAVLLETGELKDTDRLG